MLPWMPRVSVILATYNRSSLVVEAIHSVLAQSYRDYEIIVADDGSTDDTLERLAALDGHIRAVALKHSGMPEVSRNRAIAIARGDLIAFLDDDDLWQPEYLKRQVEVLDRDKNLGFVYCDICFLHSDGSVSAPRMLSKHKDAGAVLDHLLGGCFIYPSTLMVRRHLFDQVGPLDEDISSQGDFAFLLRLASVTQAGCVPEPLALIRRHSSNLSSFREILDCQNTIRIFENFQKTGALNRRQRLLLRENLSRYHTHLGLLKLGAGELQAARQGFIQALQLNPLRRRAWIALLQFRSRK